MDKQEFTERTLALERTMYCVARTYMSQPADCADCVQEALLKAWGALHTLREEKYFKTWLIRILINECRVCLKRKKRVIPMESVPDSPAPERGDSEIYAQLQALPEKYRVVAVLHYAGGYTLAQIAQTLRVPLGTVKNRLFRTREKLRIMRSEEVCGA